MTSRILVQGSGYVPIERLQEPFVGWTGDKVAPMNLTVSEPRRRVLVKLLNGVELICPPHQKFFTRLVQSKEEFALEAEDVSSIMYVRMTDKTYEFDYFDKSCYKYLSNLHSFQIGTLLGLMYCLSADGRTLDFPLSRREISTALKSLLESMDADYEKEQYYKRSDRIKYTILSDGLVEELNSLKTTDSVPEEFWKSKSLWRGFLKSLFTFSQVRTESLSISSNKNSNLLKEVQQALLLCGVNSLFCRGLKVSQLMLFKQNCYRFANDIGVFNGENLFEGLDYRKFLGYKDRTSFNMMYTKVSSVEEIEEGKIFEVDSDRVMMNGVILEN